MSIMWNDARASKPEPDSWVAILTYGGWSPDGIYPHTHPAIGKWLPDDELWQQAHTCMHLRGEDVFYWAPLPPNPKIERR